MRNGTFFFNVVGRIFWTFCSEFGVVMISPTDLKLGTASLFVRYVFTLCRNFEGLDGGTEIG